MEFDDDLPAANHDLNSQQRQATQTRQAPQPEPEPEPEAPSHSRFALAAAQEFGLTEDDVAGMTPDQLDAALMVAHKVRGKQNAKPPEPEKDPWAEFDWGEIDEADPEDPAKTRKVKLTENHYSKPQRDLIRAFPELKKQLDFLVKEREEEKRQAWVGGIDGAFDSLGEQFHNFFGAGSISDTTDDGKPVLTSEQQRQRNNFLQLAGVKNTDSPKAIRAKLTKTVTQFFGGIQQQAQRPQPQPQQTGYQVNGRHAIKDPQTNQFMSREQFARQAVADPKNRVGGQALTAKQMRQEQIAAAQRANGFALTNGQPDLDFDLPPADYDLRRG